MAVGGYLYYQWVRERTYTPRQFCHCGRDVDIGPGVSIRAPERMKIGDSVFIGRDCWIDAIGGLQLGSHCALAAHVTILTLDHHFRGAESIPWGEARLIEPVVLGDYVWVGMNASILPGVTIGEGAIVGLGTVVARDVPVRAIVVGNPARVVGYRDPEAYEALKRKGALRSPTQRCTQFWVPEEMKGKYRDLLNEVGYDVDSGREYFEFKST